MLSIVRGIEDAGSTLDIYERKGGEAMKRAANGEIMREVRIFVRPTLWAKVKFCAKVRGESLEQVIEMQLYNYVEGADPSLDRLSENPSGDGDV
jgi:hypothetical protein